MTFPTGGIVREPIGMNRCDSGTDSIVWMEEDREAREIFSFTMFGLLAPVYNRRFY